MATRWISRIRGVFLGPVVAVLLLAGCGPSPAAAPVEASDARATSADTPRTASTAAAISDAPRAGNRVDGIEVPPPDRSPVPRYSLTVRAGALADGPSGSATVTVTVTGAG